MASGTKVWTEKYAEMSHGKTRYWEAGNGYPTILIHGAGWTSGCETWVRNMGPLSEKLRVLAIDCLNWGLGDVLDQEFSFAYLVDHVREFMDVLGIDKANFVGHSMGGWIVTLLTAGLMHPWAAVRMYTYQINSLEVLPAGNVDDFVASAQPPVNAGFSVHRNGTYAKSIKVKLNAPK